MRKLVNVQKILGKLSIRRVFEWWSTVPPIIKTWLRGLEVAVLTGTATAIVSMSASEVMTKAGIIKILGVAAVCTRLYLTQSPIQNVVKETLELKQTQKEATLVVTTTSGPAPSPTE